MKTRLRSKITKVFAVLLVLGVAGGALASGNSWIARTNTLRTGFQACGLVPMGDGSFVYMGTNNADGSTGILKTDASGTVLWYKTIPGIEPAALVPNGTGLLLVGGLWINGPLTWIATLTSDGVLDQQRYLDGTFIAAKVYGTDCYLLGSDGTWVEHVAKINLSTFSVVWSKSYSANGPLYPSAIDANASGVVAVGKINGLDRAYIHDISADGATSYLKEVAPPYEIAPTSEVVFNNIFIESNGTILTTGYGRQTVDTESHLVAAKFGAMAGNGTRSFVWQKIFKGTGEEWGTGVTQLADGSVLLSAGTKSWSPDQRWDAWLVNLRESDGRLNWQKIYATPKDEEAVAVAKLSGGGAIVAAQTWASTWDQADDSLFFRVKADGNVDAHNYGGAAINCRLVLDTTATPTTTIDTVALSSVTASPLNATISAVSSPFSLVDSTLTLDMLSK